MLRILFGVANTSRYARANKILNDLLPRDLNTWKKLAKSSLFLSPQQATVYYGIMPFRGVDFAKALNPRSKLRIISKKLENAGNQNTQPEYIFNIKSDLKIINPSLGEKSHEAKPLITLKWSRNVTTFICIRYFRTR